MSVFEVKIRFNAWNGNPEYSSTHYHVAANIGDALRDAQAQYVTGHVVSIFYLGPVQKAEEKNHE